MHISVRKRKFGKPLIITNCDKKPPKGRNNILRGAKLNARMPIFPTYQIYGDLT